MIVMKFPRAMHHITIFVNLLCRQGLAALYKTMRCDRHNVGCAVGQPHARPCKRNLHNVLCEITGGMKHMLMSSSYIATRRVVVSAKMSGDTTTISGSQQNRQIDLSVMIDDRLRCFDHHLELETALA